MNYAGLIYDDSPHYLDHLAPLCAQLNCPLIICEHSIAELGRVYYPNLTIIEKNHWELKLPSHVISCYTQTHLQAAFPHANVQNIWLPHGHSDKGWKTRSFEALQGEKFTLVYGQKMIDVMREHKANPQMLCIGNFRWQYYLENKTFYEKLLKLPSTGKNFLYAPTWDDSENSCSFWNAFPHLAKKIPQDCNLLVKLHPNTVRKFEPELEVLKGKYQSQRNIFFLDELPPIYPLLTLCDGYIGDMSSIGYDFLKFDRPMFFFNASNLPLQSCGISITPQSFSFEKQEHLSSSRKILYGSTFAPTPDWKCIQSKLQEFATSNQY